MRRALLLAGLLLTSVWAHAQPTDYPQKAVKIVVPYPPGGLDILYRAIAAELSTKWRQPVVVENLPGASSIIGAESVARAAPDGYTLLATGDFTIIANRFLYSKLPYDPDKSFVPVSLVAQTDMFIVASESLPVKDLRELVAYARAHPKKLSYGSFSRGSAPDLAFEMLTSAKGLICSACPSRACRPSWRRLPVARFNLAWEGQTLLVH
jgi:tripartite-type tricarboxylate transporter receptor subunit TctC